MEVIHSFHTGDYDDDIDIQHPNRTLVAVDLGMAVDSTVNFSCHGRQSVVVMIWINYSSTSVICHTINFGSTDPSLLRDPIRAIWPCRSDSDVPPARLRLPAPPISPAWCRSPRERSVHPGLVVLNVIDQAMLMVDPSSSGEITGQPLRPPCPTRGITRDLFEELIDPP